MILYVHSQVGGVLNSLSNDPLNFLSSAFAIILITFFGWRIASSILLNRPKI